MCVCVCVYMTKGTVNIFVIPEVTRPVSENRVERDDRTTADEASLQRGVKRLKGSESRMGRAEDEVVGRR